MLLLKNRRYDEQSQSNTRQLRHMNAELIGKRIPLVIDVNAPNDVYIIREDFGFYGGKRPFGKLKVGIFCEAVVGCSFESG